MAVRFVTIWLFIVVTVIVLTSPSSVSSRKLLEMKKQENLTVREEEKSRMPHVTKTTTLTALPKGKIPTSTPSKKGHAAISAEKLRSRQLSTVDRFLQSVPSPGVGH
uniref:Precursor of CEP14 n=1 Tax=Noccaea caerulescens TaxID=107243 RepID=A0A1J3JNU2_NOCCA